MMAPLEIAAEREGDRGWIFDLRRRGGSAIESKIVLAWVDYDWWSPDGRDPPAAVALAVAEVFDASLSTANATLPAHFDASTVRKRVAGADSLIVAQLAQSP